MYDNCEEFVDYNVVFCHACLSSSTMLCAVGDYLDTYRKICDNSRLNLTSQVNVCLECMALLKEVQAFQKKVEKAQCILEYCVINKVSLDDYHIPEIEEHTQDTMMCMIAEVRGRCDIMDERPTLGLSTSSCESCDETVQTPPGTSEDEERRHSQWKRTALLVYNRICSHRHAHHFLKPVSDGLAPLYSRIVRRPTDLSTIKQRIKGGSIRTTAELTRALLLMILNALMYNSSGHKIHAMTLEFREETIRELSLLQETQAQAACPLAPELRPAGVLSAAPPAGVSLAARAARVRRASLWDASHRSAPASCLKPPPPLTRRRKSMWDASQEAARDAAPPSILEPPPPVTRRRKSLWDASQDARDAASPSIRKTPPPVTRRRKSVWDAPQDAARDAASPSILEPPPPVTRRRKSVWDAPQDDLRKTAVVQPRRKSISSKPKPAKRARWDGWPCLDKYLEVKKYKHAELL